MRIETILFILLLFILPIFAVECPPGFEWQRMSGVGCVQKDCVSKGGSYGYTQNCFCREDKSCYEAVNYSQFDGNKCKPFCPYSRLIGCVEPGEKCSNEKPTQQSCETYCKGYHGPHATAKIVGDRCDCGCKEGYTGETNKILLCQPTKATCDQYCKEYHGGDMLRGEYAYGTVRGISCDCHCNKGYIPDNTLTCVKAKNCSEECVKRMGEGGIGTGTYPDCKCDCKKGYTKHNVYDKEQKVICEKIKCPGNSTFNEEKNKCICKEEFWPEPINGVCVPLNKSKTCGNKICDSDISRKGDVPENCENCPEDCGCKSDEICNIRHPFRLGELQTSMQNPTIVKGCISEAARIIDIGCADGGGVPKVNIHRAGTAREVEFDAQVGMSLSVLDEVTLTKFTDKGMCNEPYVTLEWGNVRGTMFLGPPTLMHTLTIQYDAVQSGWPQDAPNKLGEAGVKFAIKTGIKQIIKRTVQVLGAPVRILLSPDKTAGDTVKVYVKSEILIQQNQTGTTIYTLEGEPIVEYKGRNVTVHNGSKVTIDSKGMSNATAFNPAEPGDWYLRIPDPPDNFGESSQGDIAMPELDLEGIISDINNTIAELKNTCCGSVGMIALLLVLAVWGEKKSVA